MDAWARRRRRYPAGVRPLGCSLACALLAAQIAYAGEPLPATAWDVRKDASELLDELSRIAGADPGDLLQRAATMLAAHGAELVVAAPTEARPIAEAVLQRLRQAGLEARFAEELAAAAEGRLAELTAAPPDPAALATLARSVPGTPAARRAWRLAADLAWDRGALRLYRDSAGPAGEGDDALRAPRLAAVGSLIALPRAEVPAALGRLDTMWRLELPPRGAPPAGLPRRQAVPPPALGACTIGTGTIAIADGRSLLVVDAITGHQLAAVPLGNLPLPDLSVAPVPLAGGAAAVGIDRYRLVLAAVAASGRERWRHLGEPDGIDAVSAPVAIDGLVAVAYRTSGEDSVQIRVRAVSAHDGALLWDTAVGLLAVQPWGIQAMAPPALGAHARGLVVCANAGLFALVGGDGQVRRLWSYPSRLDTEVGDSRRWRRGQIASDGATAVAAPADLPDMLLVLGPDDQTPRAYRGDGASGEILAVDGGDALVAGRQTTLIDTVQLRPRWTAPLRLTDASGALGPDTVLLAGREQLALVGRGDGKVRAGVALDGRAAVRLAGKLALLDDGQAVRAIGDAAWLVADLRAAAAAAAADDPRPHTALGTVLAARGEDDAALAAWREALARGGGGETADRMLRLLRQRILAGGPAAAAAAAELAGLAGSVPGLDLEAALWRARLLEDAGDRIAAAAAYARVRSGPGRMVDFASGLAISLRQLAAAGEARCRGTASPPEAPPAQPVLHAAWTSPLAARGRLVTSDGLVFGYASGLLRAWRLHDGSQAWTRRPQRPLLGVQPFRRASPLGVAVEVLPGSAGEAAGLRSGDVLLTLNGTPMRSFDDDLRPMVASLGVGAAFTFEVAGADGGRRTVTGALGGEPIEPMAWAPGLLLARTTKATTPGAPLRLIAIDPADGSERWSQSLSHDEQLVLSTPPLLAGGTVAAADGPDLVGFAADGAVRWRRPGRAGLLAQSAVLGDLLWLSNGIDQSLLLDPVDGAEVARVPVPGGSDRPPVLRRELLAVGGAVWDLGQGVLRWRNPALATPLAISRDALLALDQRGRAVVVDLASGQIRRSVGDGPVDAWAIDESLAVLTVAGSERRRLVAVPLDGLAATWSLELPPGIEVESLRIAAGSIVAVLRDGDRAAALLLGADGAVLAAAGSSAESLADTVPLGGGALIADGGGLRTLRPGLPAAPPALRTLVLPAGPGRREALAAALPRLEWGAAGGGATAAAARHGPHLLLVVRNAANGCALRLADAGQAIAGTSALATVDRHGTRLAFPGVWSLVETWMAADPSGGPDLAVSVWAPPPDRASGAPLAVLLGAPEALPWWLMSGWTRILDPP